MPKLEDYKIKLSSYNLFKKDPDIRFAKVYKVPKNTWNEAYAKTHLWGLTDKEGRDYLMFLTWNGQMKRLLKKHGEEAWNMQCKGIMLTSRQWRRWMNKTHVYRRAQEVIERGTDYADPTTFGKYGKFVVYELYRNNYEKQDQMIKMYYGEEAYSRNS